MLKLSRIRRRGQRTRIRVVPIYLFTTRVQRTYGDITLQFVGVMP